MTSQLIQKAVETLEKMKDDGINSDTGLPNYSEFNKGMVIGRNTTIDDIQSLLPQIITGVIEEIEEQAEYFRGNLATERLNTEYEDFLASLKEVVKE